MADVRIRWLLDVVDRGAGKKLLAQDRQIRRSLQANDAQYKKTAVSATSASAKQATATKQVTTAQTAAARAARTNTTAVRALNAVQAEGLALGNRVAMTSTRAARAYDRQAAAARRLRAAEQARARGVRGPPAGSGATALAAGGGAATGSLRRAGAPAFGGAVFGGVALAQTIQFDRAMRNVNSIAQLGEGRFRKLSAAVRELGGRTAQMPKTLAEGLYDLVSSGFSARQSLGILNKSARAASAGLTTTEVSTKAVAAVLNAYHLPASKAGKVSDQLFRTVDRGVISFEQLAETVGDVLPFASSLGVGLDEVGASVATMTKAGIGAPETMTRIKNVMVALLKPGNDLKDTIAELGYESGEQLIKTKGFQGALDELVGSTDGSKQAVAKLFPNIRALGGALALTGKNSRGASQDLKGMRDASGATSRALEQQSKSVSYQWDKLKASASGLAIEIGGRLVPGAVAGVRAIGGFVREIKSGEGAGGRFGAAVTSIATGVRNLWTVLSPIILAVGRFALSLAEVGAGFAGTRTAVVLVTAALGGLAARFVALRLAGIVTSLFAVGAAMTSVAGAATVADLAMRRLSLAFKTNPIGIIATAVGLAVGALLGFSGGADQATRSTKELADANDALYDSLKRIEDLDLDKQGRKLAVSRAHITLDAAKRELGAARDSGDTDRIVAAEQAVKEARLESKRASRDLARVEEDHRKEREAAARGAAEDVKQTRRKISEIEGERDAIKDNMRELEEYYELSDVDVKKTDAWIKWREKLRGKTKELRTAQGELNRTLGMFAGERTATIKVEGAQAAITVLRNLRSAADAVGGAFDIVVNRVNAPPRNRKRAGGMISAFAGGGLVPAAVSSGEALRLPNGRWGTVPGPRVAADNVFMPLPVGTEVFTDHGQMLLAQGASRSAALSQQMPHFQKGGRHTSYSAKQMAGLAVWAGVRGYQARVAGAVTQPESRGDRLAHALTSREDSRGLWQINVRAHPWARSWDLWNEETNARAMRRISGGGKNFGPWTGYTSGAYRSYMPSSIAPWAGSTTGRKGEWETYKGRPRPTNSPIPAARLDRWTRRRLLGGLSGEAFGTGYQAGQAGYRSLIGVSGVGDLIGGARISMERPDRKRWKGSKLEPDGGAGSFTPGGGWAGTKGLVMQAIRGLVGGQRVTYKRSVAVNGNQNSDHNTWIRNAYAADISPGGNGLFNRLKRRLGIPATLGSWNRFNNKPVRGFRTQLLWHAPDGSHKDHVHLGIRALRAGGRIARGALARFQGGGAMRLPATRGGGGGAGRVRDVTTPYLQWFEQVRQGFLGAAAIPRPTIRPLIQKVRDAASAANYAVSVFMSRLAESLDNVKQVSFAQLARTRGFIRGEIRKLMQGGVDRREAAQIQRLRASIDLVEAEMGRRTGLLVRHQQYLARVMEGRRARLEHRLRRTAVDETSSAGIDALLQVEEVAARNLKKQRADLRSALRKAQKAGDREAAGEIRDGLREINGALRENVTRKVELARDQIRAQAQERAALTDFGAQVGQNLLAGFDATQRLNRTAATPGGLWQRGIAAAGMVPLLEQQRGALQGQFTAAMQTGDHAGARGAYLAIQQVTTEITNAMAESAELIRQAAQQEAQDRVAATQHLLDVQQSGLASLDVQQRLNRTADTPEGMRDRARQIQDRILPAMQANLLALERQLNVISATEGTSSDAFRQAFASVTAAGNEIGSAMADAADLVRQAALTASQNLVDLAQHGTTMAELRLQRLELEQRLAGTFEAGGVNRAKFLRETVMPAIQAEIRALRNQERVAREQGDQVLARQIAEAVYGKENELLQRQLDAIEQVAENTSRRGVGGSTGFSHNNETLTDVLIGVGNGS